jgi:hypothetical protein
MSKKVRSTLQIEDVNEVYCYCISGLVNVEHTTLPYGKIICKTMFNVLINDIAKRFRWPLQEIIISQITSSLTLREAVQTSILSPSWMNNWKLVPNLKFDSLNIFNKDIWDDSLNLMDMNMRNAKLLTCRMKFIHAVSRVLKYHRCIGVQSFEIDFFLDKLYSRYLNEWVKFALASNAKELTIKLQVCNIKKLPSEDPCEFPCHLFSCCGGSSIEFMHIEYCSLSPPSVFFGFKNIKALDLVCVKVNDDDIQHLLSNCSVLERLSIKGCHYLVNLKLSHLLRLKYMKVDSCHLLKSIDISAIALTTFEYMGLQVRFIFREKVLQMKGLYVDMLLGDANLANILNTLPDTPEVETLFVGMKIFEVYRVYFLMDV